MVVEHIFDNHPSTLSYTSKRNANFHIIMTPTFISPHTLAGLSSILIYYDFFQ